MNLEYKINNSGYVPVDRGRSKSLIFKKIWETPLFC